MICPTMSDEKQKVKMAVIAGAARALKYKEQNPRATDTEVLRHVSEESKEIFQNITQNS